MLGLLSRVKEFVLYLKSNRNLLYGFKQSNKIIRFVLEERSFWVVMWKLGRGEPECGKTSWRGLGSDLGAPSEWRESGGFERWFDPLHYCLVSSAMVVGQKTWEDTDTLEILMTSFSLLCAISGVGIANLELSET